MLATITNQNMASDSESIKFKKFFEQILENELQNNIDFTIKNKVKFNDDLKELNKKILINFHRDDSNKLINEVKSHYKNERLVLVLGAGVSMGYGLPSWDMLLQKLMVNTIEKDNEVSTILSKLFSKIFNPSPLIAGRHLQNHFENNNKQFETEVRKLLYSNLNEDFKSELMQEILKICIAPGKSPNLNSIITYNFDDILETTLNESVIDLPYKPIFGNGIDVETGELPIYHVHGYLPRTGNLNDSNKITFGENVYHQQYTNMYSWNNIVQINKFRENNCLFIGTSLTDPNTRRLLDIANQQRTKKDGSHYILKKKYKREKVSNLLEIILKEDKSILTEKNSAFQGFSETVENLINIVQSFEETDLLSFGIKTIWIDDFDEIPEILRKIRKK